MNLKQLKLITSPFNKVTQYIQIKHQNLKQILLKRNVYKRK